MADDGKLYIIISDRPDAAGTDATDVGEVAETEDKKKQTGLDYAKHRFFNFIESQAKQTVMYGINNIGNFTGDYITQRKIQETVQMTNMLLNIGTATLAGAKYGAPGAIAGFTIAIAGTAINAGLSEYSQWISNRKINYSIDRLRERSGLNQSLDGSRGTEN